MQLKRIDVASAAKTFGAINAGLGTLMGLILALAGLAGSSAAATAALEAAGVDPTERGERLDVGRYAAVAAALAATGITWPERRGDA